MGDVFNVQCNVRDKGFSKGRSMELSEDTALKIWQGMIMNNEAHCF